MMAAVPFLTRFLPTFPKRKEHLESGEIWEEGGDRRPRKIKIVGIADIATNSSYMRIIAPN